MMLGMAGPMASAKEARERRPSGERRAAASAAEVPVSWTRRPLYASSERRRRSSSGSKHWSQQGSCLER